MLEKYLIGVDIGTQGVKAGLFNLDGKCIAQGFEKSRLFQPSPGVTEEDPEFQINSVCKVISDCVKSSSVDINKIEALSIDGQMAGVIGIGENGKNVTPYDSWLDTRCTPFIEEMKNTACAEIIRKTGNPPSINHGPKKLWWKHEKPEEYKKIKCFVQPGSYAAMQLCGLNAEYAFIDETYLHFSGFANNLQSKWDKELCKTFEFPMAKLPRIVKPSEIIGELTKEMARKCDLHTSVKIIAGCGDTAASFLACGATEEGVCIDVAGTASVFAATTKDFKPDVEFATLGIGHSVTPGLWHPYAYINGGGMNPEWFKKVISKFGNNNNINFAELDKAVESIELKETLPLFIPHMAGRVSPSQPALKGAFAGLDWTHSAEHMYRSVLEGVALEYGIYCKILKKLFTNLNLKEIRITGGGQYSESWNQMKSGVLQIPVVKLKDNLGASVGSALLAGYGAGIFASLKETSAKWLVISGKTDVSKSVYSFYQNRIQHYEKLMKSLNEFMEGK